MFFLVMAGAYMAIAIGKKLNFLQSMKINCNQISRNQNLNQNLWFNQRFIALKIAAINWTQLQSKLSSYNQILIVNKSLMHKSQLLTCIQIPLNSLNVTKNSFKLCYLDELNAANALGKKLNLQENIFWLK